MSGTENAASGNRGDNESKSTASVARRSGGGNAAAGGDNAKNHLCDCCEGKGENGSDGTSSSMIQLQTCGCTICKDCFSKWLSKSVSSLDGTSSGGSSNIGTEQNDMAWKCPSCNLLMAKSFNAQDDDSTSNRKRAAASTNSPAKRRRLPMANKGKGRLSNAGGADSDSEGSDYATPKKSRSRVTRSSSSSARDKKKNGPLKKRTESKSSKSSVTAKTLQFVVVALVTMLASSRYSRTARIASIPLVSVLAVKTTVAPAAANRLEDSKPRPEVPPVINTVFILQKYENRHQT